MDGKSRRRTTPSLGRKLTTAKKFNCSMIDRLENATATMAGEKKHRYTVNLNPRSLSAWPPVSGTDGEGSAAMTPRRTEVEGPTSNFRVSPIKLRETHDTIYKEQRTLNKLREKLRPNWFQIRQPSVPPGDRTAPDGFLCDRNVLQRRRTIEALKTQIQRDLKLDIIDQAEWTKISLLRARNDLQAWKSKTNHW